jgi:hypothetical protein
MAYSFGETVAWGLDWHVQKYLNEQASRKNLMFGWLRIIVMYLRNKHNQLDTLFTFTCTLLRFKVSTCFGQFLPIFRRHYTNAGLVIIVCGCRCGLVSEMMLPPVVLPNWAGKHNRWNHNILVHRPHNHTLSDIPPIQFVFQVTQKDLRSSLMMAGYCWNM